VPLRLLPLAITPETCLIPTKLSKTTKNIPQQQTTVRLEPFVCVQLVLVGALIIDRVCGSVWYRQCVWKRALPTVCVGACGMDSVSGSVHY